MKQPGDDSLEKAVGEVALRLQTSVDEVWKMINIGDLSVQETADGLWTIPDWSIDYLLAHRSQDVRTTVKPQRAPVVPLPAPAPEPRKKSKRKDPAKKWKQQFDKLGREKNGLNREIKALWMVKDDIESGRRIRACETRLLEVLREIKKHLKAGIRAGFVEPPKAPKYRQKKRPEDKQPEGGAPKLNLEQLGLQVGLSFSDELEVLNTFDPKRGGLELWEKPRGARKGTYQQPGD